MTAIDSSQGDHEEKDTQQQDVGVAEQDVEQSNQDKGGEGDSKMFETEQDSVRPKTFKDVFKQDEKNDHLARMLRSDPAAGDVPSLTSHSNSATSSSSALLPPSGPTPTSSSAASSAAPFEGRVTRSQTAAERGADRQRGLVGLYNLGNTCFMNAALQCMSNTKELKEYFVSGAYKSEINGDNPLGMGGAIAKVFGELLTKLWAGGSGAWQPREFKTVLSRFSTQFVGYAQHDTQELLAFLLDGLHEDLNRIHKKPYIEAPDWQGGGLKEMITLAHKQWEIYKMRNDSVIVDLFQGQYRSTLVCPDCAKVSIKFDPFMYLTLPIPNKKSFVRKVHFFGLDGRTPVEAEMRLTGESSIDKVKRQLAAWFKVDDPKCMVACDVFSKSFYRIYTDFEAANEIGTSDVTYVYQLPRPLEPVAPTSKSRYISSHDDLVQTEERSTPPEKPEEYANLPLFSTYDNSTSRVGFTSFHSRSHNVSFGQPLFISIPKEKVNDEKSIQDAVMQAYMHVADDPIALKEYLGSIASDKDDTVAANGTIEDWEMLSDNKVVVPGTQEQEENTVTEIHEDGETVTLVREDRTETGNVTREGQTSQTASSSQASKSASRPFTIHFIVHREDQAPTTLKSESFETYGEELTKRAKRLGLKNADDSMESSVHVEADEIQTNEKARSKVQWPLVYSGGALVCHWTSEARDKFFNGGSSDEGWGKPFEKFVDPELEADRQPDAKKVKRTLSIEDCLNEFTQEEQLGESDPWYCPSCKGFKQATKKFDLWKVPDILVVHLKRFSSGRISRDKIDSLIDFPVEGLDLTERVEGAKAVQQLNEEEEGGDDKLMDSIGSLDANDDAVESDAPVYDLYAVDNHFGGLGGGHYTAYAKNPEDEKWYYFDDSSVRPVREISEMKSSAAYLLFYRRRTTRPIGGKSREKVRQRVKESQEREERLDGDEASEQGQGGGDAMDTDNADVPASPSQRHGQARLDDFPGQPTLSTWDYEYENDRFAERIPGALPAYDEQDQFDDDIAQSQGYGQSLTLWKDMIGERAAVDLRQRRGSLANSDSTSVYNDHSSEGAAAASTPDHGSMIMSEDSENEERKTSSTFVDNRSQDQGGGFGANNIRMTTGGAGSADVPSNNGQAIAPL